MADGQWPCSDPEEATQREKDMALLKVKSALLASKRQIQVLASLNSSCM
jgi:hypothetical protein